MFGFKKRLNDKLIEKIYIQIAMFQSWSLDHRNTDFSAQELEVIINNYFKRDNISYKSSDVLLLRGRLLTKLKYDDVRQLRIIDGFDKNVIKFCKSINLPESYYSIFKPASRR